MKHSIDTMYVLRLGCFVFTALLISCSRHGNSDQSIDLDQVPAVSVSSRLQKLNVFIANREGKVAVIVYSGKKEIFGAELSENRKQAEFSAWSDAGRRMLIDENFDGVPEKLLFIGADGNISRSERLHIDVPSLSDASTSPPGTAP